MTFEYYRLQQVTKIIEGKEKHTPNATQGTVNVLGAEVTIYIDER